MARDTRSMHSQKQKSSIGLRLRAIREINELTQEEFAHSMGQNRLTYRMWEAGRYYPHVDAMEMVCAKYLVDYNFIFGGNYKGLQGDLAAQISQWIVTTGSKIVRKG